MPKPPHNDEKILRFIYAVGIYLQLEYDPFYTSMFNRTGYAQSIYDFLGTHYLAGEPIPNAARYLVEFMEQELL